MATTNSFSSSEISSPVIKKTHDSHVAPSIATNDEQLTTVNPTREPTQRWKKVELRVLISLKKDEHERSLHETPRDRSKTADARWRNITGDLSKHGFNRKQSLIRKKWEKLTTNFKKIFDYQKRPPSGQLGYFEMGSDDRKRFKLPPQYDDEVYTLLERWMPCRKAVQPNPKQVVDSSGHGGDDQPPPTLEADQPVTSSEANITPIATATTSKGNPSAPGEEDTENSVPNRRGAQGRLLKQTKRDRLEEHFKNANAEIVKALAMQAEKKEISNKAFLDWDKEKQKFLAYIDLKKHKEMVTMQEKISGEISGALREVSTSFMHFANAMSKRM